MIVDGRAIAEDLYTELAKEREKYSRPIKIGILVVGANPVIEQFVKIKTRAAARLNIEMARADLLEDSTTADIVEATKKLAADTDAVIVQLPLPKGVDTNAVLSAIPPEKDVDALNPSIPHGNHIVDAPVALAVV